MEVFYNQGNVIVMPGVSQNVSNRVPDQEESLDKSIRRLPWNTDMWAQRGPLEDRTPTQVWGVASGGQQPWEGWCVGL